MYRCLYAILRLALSVEHRLVADRHTTTAHTALTWRRAVKSSRVIKFRSSVTVLMFRV